MSKKCDSQKQVRLTDETYAKLVEVRKVIPFKLTLSALVDTAITMGLVEMGHGPVTINQKPKGK
jgi:hypothetical protein